MKEYLLITTEDKEAKSVDSILPHVLNQIDVELSEFTMTINILAEKIDSLSRFRELLLEEI